MTGSESRSSKARRAAAKRVGLQDEIGGLDDLAQAGRVLGQATRGDEAKALGRDLVETATQIGRVRRVDGEIEPQIGQLAE